MASIVATSGRACSLCDVSRASAISCSNLDSLGRAGDDLAPQLLGLNQRFLQRTQRVGVERRQTRALEIGRDQRIEPIQPLDLGHARQRALGAADVVQRVDHQTFGDRTAAFDHPAQLQIESRQHPLQIDIDGDRAGFERFQQSARDPPEAARKSALRHVLEVRQRFAHALARRCVVRVAQKAEQAQLEPRTPVAQLARREVARFDLMKRRPPRQVGKHQIGRMNARRLVQQQHVAVVRIQLDRLIRPAGQQAFEIRHHRRQRGFDRADRRPANIPLGSDSKRRVRCSIASVTSATPRRSSSCNAPLA